MSVLIKGMEMPKGCITCTFKSDSMFNRTMWCEWLDDPLGDYSKCDEKWRHPDCPLVEVSAPHGRLIDADNLHKAMYHRAFETDGDTMWQSGCWVRYRAIEQVQDSQPTIIEAEGEAHETD